MILLNDLTLRIAKKIARHRAKKLKMKAKARSQYIEAQGFEVLHKMEVGSKC